MAADGQQPHGSFVARATDRPAHRGPGGHAGGPTATTGRLQHPDPAAAGLLRSRIRQRLFGRSLRVWPDDRRSREPHPGHRLPRTINGFGSDDHRPGTREHGKNTAGSLPNAGPARINGAVGPKPGRLRRHVLLEKRQRATSHGHRHSRDSNARRQRPEMLQLLACEP